MRFFQLAGIVTTTNFGTEVEQLICNSRPAEQPILLYDLRLSTTKDITGVDRLNPQPIAVTHAYLKFIVPWLSIDTVFDYKQVFKEYCVNDDRWPPQQQNESGIIYSLSRAVRRQPEQSHQSQVESIVQATRSTVVTTESFVLDKVSGF